MDSMEVLEAAARGGQGEAGLGEEGGHGVLEGELGAVNGDGADLGDDDDDGPVEGVVLGHAGPAEDVEGHGGPGGGGDLEVAHVAEDLVAELRAHGGLVQDLGGLDGLVGALDHEDAGLGHAGLLGHLHDGEDEAGEGREGEHEHHGAEREHAVQALGAGLHGAVGLRGAGQLAGVHGAGAVEVQGPEAVLHLGGEVLDGQALPVDRRHGGKAVRGWSVPLPARFLRGGGPGSPSIPPSPLAPVPL